MLGQETGTNEVKVYGLPPAMALDVASSYLFSKARLSLAEQQRWKQCKPKARPRSCWGNWRIC